MFTRSIPLFSLFGFQVKLDPSWFLLAALLIWTLSAGLFPRAYPNLDSTTYFWMGFVVAIGLFVSIVLHEFAHAWVAQRFGLPMRGITLFIFGGMAEMKEESPTPKAEFLMAIAGPLASLLIALVCVMFSVLGILQEAPRAFVGVMSYLAVMNGMLLLFNMVPAFPLDGGRVLRSLLWYWKKNLKWATRITARLGGWFGALLILTGVFNMFQGQFLGGMWWVLIGLFLRQSAETSYNQVLVRQQLKDETVQHFMRTDVLTIPTTTSIRSLLEDYFYHSYLKDYPVTDETGKLVGSVSINQVRELPPADWDSQTVAGHMQPIGEDNTIAEEASLNQALAKMDQTPNAQLMVLRDQKPIGILTMKDLQRLLSMKMLLKETSSA